MNETEQEMDLRDYVLVLLKRRRLVLSVFFICVSVAAIVSFFMPKIYEISMIVTPGALGVTDSGQFISIDRSENIKSMIESGALDANVVKELNLGPKELRIQLKAFQNNDEGSNFIRFSIKEEKNKTGLGLKILNQYYHEMVDFYQGIIDAKQDSVDKQVAIITNTIKNQHNLIKLNEASLKITEEREKGLLNELKAIQDNTSQLIDKRSTLLDASARQSDAASLFASNMIQQDISYYNNLSNQLVNVRTTKENIGSTIKTLPITINDLEIEIEKLKSTKKGIRNITLIQEPKVSLEAVGPNRAQMVALSGIISLMAGIFLAFAVEEWERVKK